MPIKTLPTANISGNKMSVAEESYIVIYCTCPDSATAETLAGTLLQEKLIACANLIPGLESHYWWKGKIQKDKEVLLIMKTTHSLFKAIELLIQNNHPYQVPEIIALPIVKGSSSYLSWIQGSVAGNSHV